MGSGEVGAFMFASDAFERVEARQPVRREGRRMRVPLVVRRTRRPRCAMPDEPNSGSRVLDGSDETSSRHPRTARCACGRVEVTVEGEPLLVLVCLCDFCQKRSGNIFIASAHFAGEKVIAISGETKVYNGLEADGVGAVGVPGGIDYHFCSTCGSTLYWLFPHSGAGNIAIAVGNFVDADFPKPTTELFTKYRHGWVSPVPGAAL